MNALMILTLLGEHRPLIGMLTTVGPLNKLCPVSARNVILFDDSYED